MQRLHFLNHLHGGEVPLRAAAATVLFLNHLHGGEAQEALR